MTNLKLLIFAFLIIMIGSCVQKSYKRTVKLTLDVSALDTIKTVGVRGKEGPLSWNSDFPMSELYKDSLYYTVVSAETGYLFTEIKFTVNGQFEMNDKPNRKVIFKTGDTTFYQAIFNKEN